MSATPEQGGGLSELAAMWQHWLDTAPEWATRELPSLIEMARQTTTRLATVPAADAGLRAAVEGLADLSAAATPGPWVVSGNIHGDPYINEVGKGVLSGGNIALCNTRDDYGRSNAALIVAAVNLVRSLLAGRGDV